MREGSSGPADLSAGPEVISGGVEVGVCRCRPETGPRRSWACLFSGRCCQGRFTKLETACAEASLEPPSEGLHTLSL